MDNDKLPKLNRSELVILSSFEEADKQDREYWRSRTPHERLAYVKLLRRIKYGVDATARLQKVVEIV